MPILRKLSNVAKIRKSFNSKLQAPITLNINLTSLCNSRCIFCELADAMNIERDKELSTKEVFDIINQAAEMGIGEIGIGGGEPLIRKDAYDILAFAKEKGLDIGLASNGIIFSGMSEDEILKLKELVSYIPVSIDSIDPKENDKIRGIKGAFEKTTEGVKRLKALGFSNIGMNSVIMKSNFRMIPDLVKLAAELGIKVLTFQPVNHHSNYPFISPLEGKEEFLPDERDFDSLQKAKNEGLKILDSQKELKSNLKSLKLWALEYFKYCRTREYFFNHVNDLKYFRCYVPFAYLNIDWQGRIIPCFIMESTLNVRDLPLKEIWYDGLEEFRDHLRKEKYYEACRRCFCSFPFNLENSVLFSPLMNISLFKKLYLANLKYYF
ncbi:radical SAM protein [bacterium]|nr:radical SAM protein [bacterium]